MENLKNTNLVELVTKGGITAVLLVIILYFGGTFLRTMQEMQKDLAQIRVQIVKVQSAILSPEQVEKMIDAKIKLLEYKFHSKECDAIK